MFPSGLPRAFAEGLPKHIRDLHSLDFFTQQNVKICLYLPFKAHTLAIRNAGESAHMKLIILNKLKAKRKVKCLEIPHYA